MLKSEISFAAKEIQFFHFFDDIRIDITLTFKGFL